MEVFADVALTDIEITEPRLFKPLTGIARNVVLIIGREYFETEHGEELRRKQT